jgi:hypothetical protein
MVKRPPDSMTEGRVTVKRPPVSVTASRSW